MSENQVNSNNTQQQDISALLKVRREKLAALQAAGKNPYEEVRYPVDAYSTEILADFETYEGKTVSIAGRIMAKRVMGKASFCHIQDGKGRISQELK